MFRNAISRSLPRTPSSRPSRFSAGSLSSNRTRSICHLHVPPPALCASPLPSLRLTTKCRQRLSAPSSVTRLYSDAPQQTTFADPDRPELFYHLYFPPDSAPVYALSFLPDAPPVPDSCAVIGWLPAVAETEAEEAGLHDFHANPKFLDVLHDAIRSALRDGIDEEQKNAAIQTQQGWMHIHDMRNVPALGRIGDPDDIIGSVRVEDSKILPETYQPMPSYRLCTSDGIVTLTEGIFTRLREILAERVKTESK